MKAVIADSKITNLFKSWEIEKQLFAEAGIELDICNVTSQEEYIEKCKDADAIMLIGYKTPKEVIDACPNLKVIVRYGVGYDSVDVPACSEAGVCMCNVPDAGTFQVGSHAFALALDCLRKMTYYDRMIRKGIWDSGAGYTLHRLDQYTFGYCGFGNIARVAAKCAEPLGCRRIAYDPFVADEVFEQAGVERVTFDELLAQSDMISVHTPLMKETFHMFSTEQFKKMKKGSVIVNTARGGVIDQEALMDAMDEGIIVAAGLDCNEYEPLTDLSNRLFKYDGVIITPHSATESVEYFTTLQEKATRTAIAVLNGELPKNTINRKEIEAYREAHKA